MRRIPLFLSFIFFAGCATSASFDNTFDYGEKKTASVVLSAPNISAPHNPPIFIGVAYLEVYEKESFCEKVPYLFGERFNEGKPIGKMFAHAGQRKKEGEIPVGDVVIRAGLEASSFGSFECDQYFSFDTKANRTYEVEVRESRPLVTGCRVSVKEQDLTGASTEPSNLNSSKERFILDDDLSNLCGEASGDDEEKSQT